MSRVLRKFNSVLLLVQFMDARDIWVSQQSITVLKKRISVFFQINAILVSLFSSSFLLGFTLKYEMLLRGNRIVNELFKEYRTLTNGMVMQI